MHFIGNNVLVWIQSTSEFSLGTRRLPLSVSCFFLTWSWASGWIPHQIIPRTRHTLASRETLLRRFVSTPFEADLYSGGNFDDDDVPSTTVPPDTRLVVGLNKYSHDTALCAADAETGAVLYASSKERLTRRKHDSGNAVGLIDACLEALQLDLDNIDTVVQNNHHYRIHPLEANLDHMEWESGLRINGGSEDGYEEVENRLDKCSTRLELSHHLAHAYSVAAQAPMESGLVVIMDGMGETYRTMQHAQATNDTTYVSDFTVARTTNNAFDIIPSNLDELVQTTSRFDWREAESVYTFTKSVDDRHLVVQPIWKRFVEEISPPVLYNHGFENMDSLGALYSRVSSHIFGDWNACGKVMGLAPWADYTWTASKCNDNGNALEGEGDSNEALQAPTLTEPIVSGHLYEDGGLTIDRQYIQGQPLIARNDPELFTENGVPTTKRYDFDRDAKDGLDDIPDEGDTNSESSRRRPTQVALEAIALAQRIQIDLETVAMDFVKYFQQETGATNLCLAGGVALNSVLNGRLSRELGFAQTFIPPYPGDDGVAVGCCAFGLFGLPLVAESKESQERPPLWQKPLSPYMGRPPTETEIKLALDDAAPWLEVERIPSDDERYQLMVDEISSGGVIAWYQSRSEMGPRALGHRSILADPRKAGLVRFINEHVKCRESFRPFAPSVLAEYASEWFELAGSEQDPVKDASNVSPYMSLTAQVRAEYRGQIPAVTHVDGSSRLQTVSANAEPAYHAFISKFEQQTGIPMVLNTSFNTIKGEPIVETPTEAIRSFLTAQGNLEFLVMGGYVVRRKRADLRHLLGERPGQSSSSSSTFPREPACPQRAGPAWFESSFAVSEGPTEPEEVQTQTRVRMPDRPLHHPQQNNWFELLDDLEGELLSVCDGSTTMNQILLEYTAVPDESQVSKAEATAAMEETEVLLQNILHRMVRLYENTFIYW